MIPPTSIDGTDITGATIDGTEVTEITVDGDTVFTAGPGGVASGATLLAHYPLDEGSGTTAADFTGNQGDITLENGASFVSDADGIGGFSVDCDGIDDFLELNPEPTFTSSSYTVMMTIDLDSSGLNQTFYSAEGDGRQVFGHSRDPGTVFIKSFGIGAGGSTFNTVQASTSATTSRTRYGVEFNANALPVAIYVNGSDVTLSSPNSNTPNGGSNPPVNFMRGNNGAGQADGKIDNIVFYDGSLSSSEVTADFNAQPYS